MTAQIYELGDSALTIEFGNEINESVHQEVMKRFYQFQSFPLSGTLDLIPAYASLTIVFDLGVVASRFEGLAGMKNLIEKKLAEDFTGHLPEGRLHEALWRKAVDLVNKKSSAFTAKKNTPFTS
jgi:allophanate hydrolase subunit 1